jgi:hypothetical protein
MNDEILKSQELATVEAEINDIEFNIDGFTVAGESELMKATEWLSVLVNHRKRVESERTYMKAPVLEQCKRIDNFFNRVKDKIQGIENVLRQKVGKYVMAKQEEQRKQEEERQKVMQEELRRAKEEKREVENIELPAVVEAPTYIRTDLGKAVTKKIWKFEITDEKDVPKKYLSVDEKKIRQAVKDGVREIKGVRIYEDIVLAVS